MDNSENSKSSSNKQLAAVCGLFCPGCTLYIASTEDPERLKRLATMFGISEEEIRCLGCRSEVRGPYCQTCKMVECAAERGVEFCAQCSDYPCEILIEFQEERPHRADLFEDGEKIREVGFEKWFNDTFDEYSCPQCETINSAYDIACRRCGTIPSCSFVERNREVIEKHLSAVNRTDEEDRNE